MWKTCMYIYWFGFWKIWPLFSCKASYILLWWKLAYKDRIALKKKSNVYNITESWIMQGKKGKVQILIKLCKSGSMSILSKVLMHTFLISSHGLEPAKSVVGSDGPWSPFQSIICFLSGFLTPHILTSTSGDHLSPAKLFTPSFKGLLASFLAF